MYDFEMVRPATVREAVDALAHEDAQILGGGQTLIPTMKARLARMERLVSLGGITEMRYVRVEEGDGGATLVLGGGTTHAQAAREAAPHYPALASLAARIGDPAVRARGTVGGSLANDDPSACWPAAALGSGATIVATGKGGAREIEADAFFVGMFTTALEEGEIVTEVRFPIPRHGAAYEKVLQPASRFPLVAAFVARHGNGTGDGDGTGEGDGIRVAVTGASQDGVFRWREAEHALAADFSASALDALDTPDPQTMIQDLHGTKNYRAHLCRVTAKRAVAGIRER